MSDAYRAICMSHHPAMVITGAEWSSTAELEGNLAAPERCPELARHHACELLGGRYSYPLIAVYSPAKPDTYSRGEWINVTWLRLLLAADAVKCDGGLNHAVGGIGGRWSLDRVTRFRHEILGIDP